jgi:hypothetical protein
MAASKRLDPLPHELTAQLQASGSLVTSKSWSQRGLQDGHGSAKAKAIDYTRGRQIIRDQPRHLDPAAWPTDRCLAHCRR